MRRLFHLLIFTLMTVPFSAGAQGISFEPGFLPQVFAKAKELNKPVFVDVFATWCKPCHYLDDVVFADSALIEYINKHFVSTQLDAEVGEGIAFAEKYLVGAYPTLLVFSPEGELMDRREGVLEAQPLKLWLAMATSKNMPTSKTMKSNRTRKRQSKK